MKVEMLPTYRIAYIRQTGSYGPANIHAMEKLKKWAEEQNLMQSAIIFGIPQDNPNTTPPENCRFDACIVLSSDNAIDDAVLEGELSGGKYAIYPVKHTSEDMQQAWTDIFPALQNNGFQLEDKPILERYTSEMVNNGYCELCVPIK